MSTRLAMRICREVNSNPQTTAKALVESLDQAGMKSVTVHQLLYTVVFHECRPRKMLLLGKRHLKARLAFAKGHMKQDPSFQLTIPWSDEANLELSDHLNAEYVRRREGKHTPNSAAPPSWSGVMVMETQCHRGAFLPTSQEISSSSKKL